MKYTVKAKDNSTVGGQGLSVGTFNRGDLVVITCNPEATWSIGNSAAHVCTALGNTACPGKVGTQTMFTGALVASIDNGVTFIQVGSLLELTIIQDKTTVKLYCFDINNGDNSGELITFVRGIKA